MVPLPKLPPASTRPIPSPSHAAHRYRGYDEYRSAGYWGPSLTLADPFGTRLHAPQYSLRLWAQRPLCVRPEVQSLRENIRQRSHLVTGRALGGSEDQRSNSANHSFFRPAAATQRMNSLKAGGGSGIRTHVTVSRKHAFQACAFSHSATPPLLLATDAATRNAA